MKRWDQIRRHFQTQSHCPELLKDGSEAQRKYKREMQESWLAIPEDERLLLDKAIAKKEKLGLPTPAASRDQTVDVEDLRTHPRPSIADISHFSHDSEGLLLLSAATAQTSPLKRVAVDELAMPSSKRVLLDPQLEGAMHAPIAFDSSFRQ